MAVTAGPDAPIELAVSGMTCAACAARIEKRLNLLDGVSATVNYATERVYVTAAGGRGVGELITAIEAAGYTAALPEPAGSTPRGLPERARDLRFRLLVCGPLALVVVVLAMVPSLQFTGWQWNCLVLTIPVAGWGAWPLHQAAWARLHHATATMDTLVSLGIAASFLWSCYALLFGGAGMEGMRMPFTLHFGPVGTHTLYLDVAAGVTVSVLTGRYLEARAKDRAGSVLASLAMLGAKTVCVLHDGAERRISADSLVRGDTFVVRPGEKIATDGTVLEGCSAVDASLLTGESIPAEVGPGDEVTGGTVNQSGRLVVQASRVGAHTTLAQIVSLVTSAQTSKANAQRLADRIAAVFVPCVICLAVVTLGFWIGAGVPANDAWGASFAVLVVACPCALGLATTTALLAGTGRGAELGILIRNMQALESARRVEAVLLDKTGTLTTGVMAVQQVLVSSDADEKQVVRLAGAVENCSEHPVGQAIARHAGQQAELEPAAGFVSLPGLGVMADAGGRTVTCGSMQLFLDLAIAVPADLRQAADIAADRGHTVVLVGWDGQARGLVSVADSVRPTAAAAVRELAELGAHVMLVTGDNRRAAEAIAARVGLDSSAVFPEARPQDKVALVRRLQADGLRVAVVGDGVNDAAALAQADLGMAIGSGTDVAIGAADITLVGGDLRAAARAIRLARSTLHVIHANLAWAFGYNLVAIPLAALGYLNPLFAGIAMAASSLIVVGNSLRLRLHRADTHGTRGKATSSRAQMA
jgi:P-type Cu+ transporter